MREDRGHHQNNVEKLRLRLELGVLTLIEVYMGVRVGVRDRVIEFQV